MKRKIDLERREHFQRAIRAAQPLYAAQYSSPIPMAGVANREERIVQYHRHKAVFQETVTLYNECHRAMGWLGRLWYRNVLQSERRAIDAHRRHIRWVGQRLNSFTSPFYKELGE